MGPIPRERMGNATSVFNLLRNIGGSIGIAMSATMVERFQQSNINRLGEHISGFSTQATQRLEMLRQFLFSQGADPHAAAAQSQAMMFGMVQQQAAILAYVEAFRILSLIFLLLVPLILIMKKPKARQKPMAAH
jgi:DHA2 family multidrug resistance protein